VATSAAVVTLNKAIQVILTVTGPTSVTYGTTGMITYTGGSGTGDRTYSHGASTGCAVDSITGVITVINTSGNCIVTVAKAGDNNYLAATSVGFPVTLSKAPGSVSINNIPSDAVYGGSFTPTFTKLGDGTTGVSSLTAGTCTVTAGVVHFVALGTCTLQASVTGSANYLAAWGPEQSFTIGKNNQTIWFTSTAPASTVVGGITYTPTATATSGLPVEISLDASSSGCSLSGLGVVSFTGVGVCVIDANQTGSINYNAAPQVQQSILVVQGIKIYMPLVYR
jgi:hypothetical protein